MRLLSQSQKQIEQLSQNSSCRIYLSPQWYINVDENGFLLGACAEGALGYILQLMPAPGVEQNNRAALKIPRLRGDTLQENADYNRIMEVESAKTLMAGHGEHLGLIGLTNHDDRFLRCPRQLAYHADKNAVSQDGCVPFFSFSKDGRVRVCNVKYESGQLLTFPPNLKQHFESMIANEGQWSELGNSGEGFFASTIYVGMEQNLQSSVRVRSSGPLDRALGVQLFIPPWYAGLPSIVFDWAHRTLQRTVSKREHHKWKPADHYVLSERILAGLHTLHSHGILHADVRPANVMSMRASSDASGFALIDYGSFANDQHADGNAADVESLPPSVARHRTSIFYARERRGAVEREDADIAIILSQASLDRYLSGIKADAENVQIIKVRSIIDKIPKDEYFIWLGWKIDLVEKDSNRLGDVPLHTLVLAWADMIETKPARRQANDPWSLWEGDQVRIRDYVFKIADYKEYADSFAFSCNRSYSRVLNEKIAVGDNPDLFEDKNRGPAILIDLPRWIEIRQSSVATDLYGVGIISLYVMYHAATYSGRLGTESTDTKKIDSQIEADLSAIITRLEDENSFNRIWEMIDDFAGTIDRACPQKNPNAATILNDEVQLVMTSAVDDQENHEITPHKITFRDSIKNLVETIIYLSPELLKVLDYFGNIAHFLLYMHFILSCIHRRSHYRRQAYQPKALEGSFYPFCKDRFEAALGSDAATAAMSRLVTLRYYLGQEAFFLEFDKQLKDVVNEFRNVPKGDIQIREELMVVRHENQSMQDTITVLRKHLEESKFENQSLIMQSADAVSQHRQTQVAFSEIIDHILKARQFLEERAKGYFVSEEERTAYRGLLDALKRHRKA